MIKHFLGLMLMILALAASASAQEALEIPKQNMQVTVCEKKTRNDRAMFDRDYNTYYALKKSGTIEIKAEEISGVYLQFYDRAMPCEIQVKQQGAWCTVATGEGNHLSDYFSLPVGCDEVRVVNCGKGRMFLAELTVFGPGEKPLSMPQWRDIKKADMMMIVAHPDDELLWFGGMLPTYAGEKGMAVEVLYLVPTTPNRRLELLDGLWTCGVTAYPAFAGFKDARANTLTGQYKHWNKTSVYKKVITFVRRFQPEVIVTQDIFGEYGHGAHRVTADAAQYAFKHSADGEKFKDSAKEYGVWQVKKLYIHLYGQNVIQFNWKQPLEHFDGRDGITVAEEALRCHASQVKHGWQMEEGGENDNTLFGLYASQVGLDVEKNDLFENIPTDCLTTDPGSVSSAMSAGSGRG